MKAVFAYVLLAGGFSALGASETLETLQAKLAEAAAKVTTLSCVQHVVLSSDMGGTGSLNSEGGGVFEYAKKDGKAIWRLEDKTEQVQKSASGESKGVFESLKFDDGDRTWMMLDSGGSKKAYKLRQREQLTPLADKTFFDVLQKDNTVKALADQELDGKAHHVIESTPKMFEGKLSPGQATTTYFVQPDTALIVKIVINDMKGKPMSTTTRTDIKINPTIDPARFAPPPGVQVEDMGKG
jgi:outer membrane lipoprotein-sorting protein